MTQIKKIVISNIFLLFVSITFCLSTPIFAEKTTQYPVIFIHGIGGGFFHWEPMVERSSTHSATLRYDDDDVLEISSSGAAKQPPYIWNVSYYSYNAVKEAISGDIELYATRLNTMIQLIRSITGAEKVSLVAHSMGGLVARAAMVQSEDAWQQVSKLLTVGTPHMGVSNSIEIGGQLTDLKRDSDFLSDLNEKWDVFTEKDPSIHKRWGVVGAVAFPKFPIKATSIDVAGLGYIEIQSALPNGEWKTATQKKNWEKANYKSPQFGFSTAFKANHISMLNHKLTREAVTWVQQSIND